MRTNVKLLFILSLVIQVGMAERFGHRADQSARIFCRPALAYVLSDVWDFSMLFGSIGLFFTLFFLFIRSLPMIAISEVRELVHVKQEHGG